MVLRRYFLAALLKLVACKFLACSTCPTCPALGASPLRMPAHSSVAAVEDRVVGHKMLSLQEGIQIAGSVSII